MDQFVNKVFVVAVVEPLEECYWETWIVGEGWIKPSCHAASSGFLGIVFVSYFRRRVC